MKLLAAALLLLSTRARALPERIEPTPNGVLTSMVSKPGAPAAFASQAQLPNSFYVFSGVYDSQTESCDDFRAKVRILTSDWKHYPHPNMYSLIMCTWPQGLKSRNEFIYALDSWAPNGMAEIQAFLRDHQGKSFEGQPLDFSLVTSIDVRTVLALSSVAPTGATAPIHSAERWTSYPDSAHWYWGNHAMGLVLGQTDVDVFLKWVEQSFAASEVAPFKAALPSAGYVGISDFFTTHLANGQQATWWLGLGSGRKCSGPCFGQKAPPVAPAGPALRSLSAVSLKGF